jgi:hypothetical protein
LTEISIEAKMDLLPIGTGRYAVLVALEESERCQPLDVIEQVRGRDDRLASNAVQLLTRFLPSEGLSGVPRSLQSSLKGENKGIVRVSLPGEDRLRLYLFMDGLWIIVCAGADLGEEESSTQGLEHARKVRREYYPSLTVPVGFALVRPS